MATIDLVSNLLPGILSAEGRRRQEATQALTSQAQAGGESLLGGIEGLTAVAPAASQQKRNLAGLFTGITGVNVDVRSPIEKVNAQLAASGVDMNTSAGLFQAATLANNAGLTQQAVQLTAMGNKKRQEEQETARKNFNFTNFQNALLKTARDERDVEAIRNAADYSELEAIRERLAPGGEAVISNFSIVDPNTNQRTLLGLPADKDGNLFYKDKWYKPSELRAIKVGDDLSKVSSSLRGPEQQEDVKVNDPTDMLRWAAKQGFILAEGTDPQGEILADAIRNGSVANSPEGVRSFFEGLITPKSEAQRLQEEASRKANVLSLAETELRAIDRALNLVLDPTTDVGGLWQELADPEFISLGGINEQAKELNSLITTIRSNEALSKIEELKNKSAAIGGEGTGLGQVQIKEFEALQSSIQNIATKQSKSGYERSLNEIKFHLINLARLNSDQDPFVDMTNPLYSQGALQVQYDPQTGRSFYILDRDSATVQYVVPISSINEAF